jgi:hypothetical protein
VSNGVCLYEIVCVPHFHCQCVCVCVCACVCRRVRVSIGLGRLTNKRCARTHRGLLANMDSFSAAANLTALTITLTDFADQMTALNTALQTNVLAPLNDFADALPGSELARLNATSVRAPTRTHTLTHTHTYTLLSACTRTRTGTRTRI